MSATDVRGNVKDVDMKLEVVVIPVSDVDRSTQFYGRLGWRQDVTPPGIVQFTPHGSSCSVQFGANLTKAAPGSAREYLIVSDIESARDTMVANGIDVGEVFHIGPDGPINGPDPDRRSYLSRAMFSDPDGNSWVLQEITARLPGRVESDVTAFGSATDLAEAMKRAAIAHGEHEKRVGGADVNWPAWYAQYMVSEQTGAQLPT